MEEKVQLGGRVMRAGAEQSRTALGRALEAVTELRVCYNFKGKPLSPVDLNFLYSV